MICGKVKEEDTFLGDLRDIFLLLIHIETDDHLIGIITIKEIVLMTLFIEFTLMSALLVP